MCSYSTRVTGHTVNSFNLFCLNSHYVRARSGKQKKKTSALEVHIKCLTKAERQFVLSSNVGNMQKAIKNHRIWSNGCAGLKLWWFMEGFLSSN